MRPTTESAGFVFGMMGFVFAIVAMNQVSALEKKLKEKGILDEESK